ncbi:MAG: MFS transporter [Planctomycetes bacterium]|nr:MFS transporter [Planctomycetota bacterium]
MNQTADSLTLERPTRVRYGVLTLISSLSLLTYLDRVCISRVAEDMQRDLGLNTSQMGIVFGAFAIGYGIFEVPGGWMGDMWGARRIITRIVLWWSLFTAVTGLVGRFSLDTGYALALGSWEVPILINSFLVLVLIRFLFGCGEAGAYPNVARVIGTWFPYHERGMAQSFVWTFARLGGFLAPLIIGALTAMLGWQRAFWVLGLLGIVWVVIFHHYYRDQPEEVPRCNDAERKLIRGGVLAPESAHHGAGQPTPWRRLFLTTSAFALFVAAFCVNLAWYFFPTWQPRFYRDVFQLSPERSAFITGLPFFLGAVGAFCGGNVSDWLIRRTGNRRWGRSIVGMIGFGGAGACFMLVPLATEAWHAVTLFCVVFLINDLAVPVIWATCTDIGGRFAGTFSGTVNMVGCIGAFLGPALTGGFLESAGHAGATSSWTFIFGLFGAAWIVSGLAWIFIDASKVVET